MQCRSDQGKGLRRHHDRRCGFLGELHGDCPWSGELDRLRIIDGRSDGHEACRRCNVRNWDNDPDGPPYSTCSRFNAGFRIDDGFRASSCKRTSSAHSLGDNCLGCSLGSPRLFGPRRLWNNSSDRRQEEIFCRRNDGFKCVERFGPSTGERKIIAHGSGHGQRKCFTPPSRRSHATGGWKSTGPSSRSEAFERRCGLLWKPGSRRKTLSNGSGGGLWLRKSFSGGKDQSGLLRSGFDDRSRLSFRISETNSRGSSIAHRYRFARFHRTSNRQWSSDPFSNSPTVGERSHSRQRFGGDVGRRDS